MAAPYNMPCQRSLRRQEIRGLLTICGGVVEGDVDGVKGVDRGVIVTCGVDVDVIDVELV